VQRRRPLVCAVALLLSSSATANGPEPISRSGEISVAPHEGIPVANTDLVIAPIPISNPTIGSGLAVAAMYMYSLDPQSRSSISGVGGGYTDSDSWAAGLMQRLSLDGDRYRINAVAAYAQINYDFFGIGSDAGSDGRSIPLHQHGYTLIPEISVRVLGNFYLGTRLRYFKVSTELGALSEFVEAPDGDTLDVTSSGLGLLASYDTRDREFSPRHGVLVDFRSNVAREEIGSDFNYENLELSINGYVDAWRGDVLAMRAHVCNTSGRAPFFDICLFGAHSDLRGYISGQHRDKAMAAMQIEYRATLTARFGAVVFAGVGAVAPSLGKVFDSTTLGSVGAGLRFLAAPRQGVTLSLDYAAGRDSEAWYVYIGDSF
jgi:outer membrane protein assembly factor BamA